MQRGHPSRFFGKDFVFFVHGFEQVRERAKGLGLAQKQKPFGLEGVVERGQHLALRVLFEINQQVAATDQVHPREGRIAEQILPGEDDHLAQELGGAVPAVLLRKEPAQPFRREVADEAFGIKTGAGFIE